jgi:hypothetical protein
MRMRVRWAALGFLVLRLAGIAYAEDGRFSVEQREQMIRAFLDEPAFAYCTFPRDKAGIRIEGGSIISPSAADIKPLVERSGAAAKPGERVKIIGERSAAGAGADGGRPPTRSHSEGVCLLSFLPRLSPASA